MFARLLAIKIVAGLLLLTSCAPGRQAAPSGAGVQSGIVRSQRFNDVAVVHNANAMTRVQRIEAKAQVIEKFWGK